MTTSPAPSTPAKPAQAPPAQASAPAPPPFRIVAPATRKDRYLKALLWGAFGTGKTWLAASSQAVPEMQDVLYIDAESGDSTLQEEWPDVSVVPIDSYPQVARAYEFLRMHCALRDRRDEEQLLTLENRFRGDESVDKPHHYYTVVLDSISEIQGYMHYQMLGIKLDKVRLDDEMGKIGWDEFDASVNKMRLLARAFRDLPMNVIIVAGEDDKSSNGRIIQQVNLQGKLKNELPGFMDVVGYLQAGTPDEGGAIKRRLNLASSKTWKAKSRLSSIKALYIDDPTMAKLADAARVRHD